jgi:hypothetical protein
VSQSSTHLELERTVRTRAPTRTLVTAANQGKGEPPAANPIIASSELTGAASRFVNACPWAFPCPAFNLTRPSPPRASGSREHLTTHPAHSGRCTVSLSARVIRERRRLHAQACNECNSCTLHARLVKRARGGVRAAGWHRREGGRGRGQRERERDVEGGDYLNESNPREGPAR